MSKLILVVPPLGFGHYNHLGPHGSCTMTGECDHYDYQHQYILHGHPMPIK